MIVLDASAVVELLFATSRGRHVARRIGNRFVSLHAPAILDLEVAQVVRRYVQSGSIGAERGSLALRHLQELDIKRWASTSFLLRIWALRENLTAYDAAYVSLAEVLKAPLLTGDRKLLEAPGHAARVDLI